MNGKLTTSISQKIEIVSLEAKLDSIRAEAATKQQVEKLRTDMTGLKKSLVGELDKFTLEMCKLEKFCSNHSDRLAILSDLVFHLLRSQTDSSSSR